MAKTVEELQQLETFANDWLTDPNENAVIRDVLKTQLALAEALRKAWQQRDEVQEKLRQLASGEITLHELCLKNGGIDLKLSGQMADVFMELFVGMFEDSGATNFLGVTLGKGDKQYEVTIENKNGKSLATISNEQKQQIKRMEAVVELAKEMAQAPPILDHHDVPNPRQRMWQFRGDDMQPLIDAVAKLEVAITNADG